MVKKVKMYHLETKPIQRSKGRSSVASSAYRMGIKMKDEQTGKVHDYRNKSKNGSVLATGCFMYQDGQKINLNPSELWNVAERAEKRKDGRTARDYIIHLRHEWTDEQRKQAVEEMCKHLAEKYNVAVNYAIHAPDQAGDNRNYHVHILTTTRAVSLDKDNYVTLGEKTDIEKENKELKEKGLPVTQDQIVDIRKTWANIANKHLELANIDVRIDHRSYAEQGITQIPTVKLGVQASESERQGVKTRKGALNDIIHQANEQGWRGSIDDYITKRIADLEQQIIIKSRLPEITAPVADTNAPTIGKPVATTTPTIAPVATVALPQVTAPDTTVPVPSEPTQADNAEFTPTPPPPQVYATATDEYNSTKHHYAEQFFRHELAQLKEQGKPIYQQIQKLKESEPKFLKGKWQKQMNVLLEQYNPLRQQYDDKKAWGVSISHENKAYDYIKEHQPDLYQAYQDELTKPPVANHRQPPPPPKLSLDDVIEHLTDDMKKQIEPLIRTIDTMPNGENKQLAIEKLKETLDKQPPPPPTREQQQPQQPTQPHQNEQLVRVARSNSDMQK